jgi:hypothetical protein
VRRLGTLILWIIVGHFIADYLLQFDRLNKFKEKNVYGILIHCAIHFSIYVMIIIVYSVTTKQVIFSNDMWVLLIIITSSHYLLDDLKINFDDKINQNKASVYTKSKLKVSTYVLDQLFHIIIIFIAFHIVLEQTYDIFKYFILLIGSDDLLGLTLEKQIPLTIIILLINTYFVGYLISKVLEPFKPKNSYEEIIIETKYYPNNELDKSGKSFRNLALELSKSEKRVMIQDSPPKAGVLIGLLERTMILILVMHSAIASIGFIVAMKALTRFKQFDDKSFAEYYLIGNMLSILMGLIAGYFMKSIWG